MQGTNKTRVCYFGLRGEGEPRSQIQRKGLRRIGVDVFELQREKSVFPWFAYLKLMKRYVSSRCFKCDAVIVPEYGYYFVRFGKLTNKPLIFDPLISIYDTVVLDRKEVGRNSVKAKRLYWTDKFSCEIADIVVLDSFQHIRYFHELFSVDIRKFRRVLTGADEDIFFPREVEKDEKCFKVLWYGKYHPLHGVRYIIQSAKILEKYKDIRFELIGSGVTFERNHRLAKSLGLHNVKFQTEWIEYEAFVRRIAMADVILGVFGGSAKARNVIPNKVYQSVAMRQPVITGGSPAIREVFVDKKNILLCEMANPQSLADAILLLREDVELRRRIAYNGYRLFKSNFTTRKIGEDVKRVVEEAIELTR